MLCKKMRLPGRLACLFGSVLIGLTLSPVLQGQGSIGRGQVAEIYRQHCALCHGHNLDGGMGGSLLVEEWIALGPRTDDDALAAYLKKGAPEKGMPAFEDVLSDKEIRALVVFINEKRHMEFEEEAGPSKAGTSPVYQTEAHNFAVETLVEGLSLPWGITFLPDDRALVTELGGTLRILENGHISEPIENIPESVRAGQGGLFASALHPDFAENGWIYLVYNAPSQDGNRSHTQVSRGRLDGQRWIDNETVYRADDRHFMRGGRHFGSRIVFIDGYLYFATGDRGDPETSQDLGSPNGKIHRLHDDGRIPSDNPFFDKEGAISSVWSYGHRNPQGLAVHPETQELWSSEHGPRGGDEINRIGRGKNYGWPVVTHGINYNGTPITDRVSAPGMEDPKLHWTPSISVCGIGFYTDSVFEGWRNNLFAGGLRSQQLHRLVIEAGDVVKDEILLRGEGRIRDVQTGPDGLLYVVLNDPHRIVRLIPAD